MHIFTRKTAKIIAPIMCAVMLLTMAVQSAALAPAPTSQERATAGAVDYTIESPYESVDWDTWEQFKANLHCHTWASDGDNNFSEMVEKHYELGYDFLAVTDHGVSDKGWVNINTVPMMNLLVKFDQKDISLKATGVTEERFKEITTPGEDGKTMLRVPYGIENNPTSFNNAHVNSWFCDYGDGVLGGTSDYERPIKGVQAAGGLSVINHPGEYTGAKKESDPELAYNEDYNYQIKKFTSLLLKYDSCIGIDINSKGDGRTHNDRKLWDILLQNCIPNGRSVLAIGSSDAHRFSAVDSGWTVHCLESYNVDNFKASMETGAFFAASRNIKNPKELSYINEALGETVATGEWNVPTEANVTQPKVTQISSSNDADTVTISAENARLIRWIADGEQIAVTTTADKQNGSVTSTLSLDEYSDKIGSYVRAEVFGDGGVLYTQAFVLKYDGSPAAKDFSKFFDFGKLIAIFRDGLLKILDWLLPLWDNFWEFATGHASQV